MRPIRIATRMPDETAFDAAEFLGAARRSKRDPYRLGLFARHFEVGEEARGVLPVSGGTLVVTDRRLLHFTTHLEVDGAWNVREFTGYAVSREIPLDAIADARRSTQRGARDVRDTLQLTTPDGLLEFIVSEGPERVVSDEDFAQALALLTRRSPSRD